jgi:hypothetical protein
MLRFAQHDNRVQELVGQLKAKGQGAILVRTLPDMSGGRHSEGAQRPKNPSFLWLFTQEGCFA